MTGREKFRENKKIIIFVGKLFKIIPKSILLYMWNCSNNHSQVLFVALRYCILKARVSSCGDNVKIGTNVQILGWDKLIIGNNVSIHSNCYIDANGGIEIGNNVSIAHNSTILSSNHGWNDETLPIKYNPLNFEKVRISDDVWVGCGVRILSGVIVGERVIIAAGAVVNRSIESKTVVGGIPAKLIKSI